MGRNVMGRASELFWYLNAEKHPNKLQQVHQYTSIQITEDLKKLRRKWRSDLRTVEVPVCPYCNSLSVCQDSKIIYSKSYGYVWTCINYPKCDAYVGCHPGTKKALGRLANAELREWKKKAHAALDPIWKTGVVTRHQAYGILAKLLGLPRNKTHIAMFDIDTCQRVVKVMKDYL